MNGVDLFVVILHTIQPIHRVFELIVESHVIEVKASATGSAYEVVV